VDIPRGKEEGRGQFTCSEKAIGICLVVRKVHHLPLRQTQGFTESFFLQMQPELPVPCYTQISRRCQSPAVDIQRKQGHYRYGGGPHRAAGVWGRRMERKDAWLGQTPPVDETARGPGCRKPEQAEAAALATNSVHDAALVKKLLGQIEADSNSFTGHGACDKARKCLCERAVAQGADMLQCMPPQTGAVVDTKGRGYTQQRDADISAMRRLGRRPWKIVSNYHQRSKAETFMYPYKVTPGGQLMAGAFTRQQTEVKVCCNSLNLMPTIAKPQSERGA